MSKVITFSRKFPAYHPKKGQHTCFVEKIWNEIGGDPLNEDTFNVIHSLNGGNVENIQQFFDGLYVDETMFKHHTIRAGKRWNIHDKFSPRVWSGKPYNSKQIIIAPDITIVNVWDIELTNRNKAYDVTIDGTLYDESNGGNEIIMQLAWNDGLTTSDFLAWFPLKNGESFEGQIICWNKKIQY